MFRNRKNSQKPGDELIQRFQKTFSDVVPQAPNCHAASFNQSSTGPITPAKLSIDSGDLKLSGTIPRPGQDIRFAPSYVDPNSLSFINPLSQPQGYYTPNSSGLGAVFHNLAGDLHTPSMGLNMITPPTLPQHIASATINANPTAMGFEPFNQSYITPHFQNPQPLSQQSAFAPAFVHCDSGYDAIDESVDELSLNDMDVQGNPPSHLIPSMTQRDQVDIPTPGEKFRYHVTLRAPTAMIRDQNEVPVSYLNKGQAYSVSVIDSAPPPPMNGHPVKYRTYIRVSFQDKEHRSKPAACWQLWKEGRGLNEAHQRGGKLQAVEYVDPIQGGIEDQKNRQIQLESSSFDGFCVTWTASATTGASECAVSVRFNFLSTDFSHSKGVKGIPVRLCAKTEIVSPDNADPGPGQEVEVCYCKVKLFRDHGAERKLSNDVAHVKKTIEKLRQQISQAEMGAGSYGKRKRTNGSIALKCSDARPTKITKHKRSWSMGSQDGDRLSMGDDLHIKLGLMQEMFTSTRPVSILGLRGDEQDDPDLYPVQLPEARDFIKEGKKGPRFGVDGSAGFPTLSPTNSCISLSSTCNTPPVQSQAGAYYDSGYQCSVSTSAENSRPGSEVCGDKVVLKHPIKIQKVAPGEGETMPMGFIEAVDIDPTYRPPAERQPKPIACFYIRFPRDEQSKDDYYRAVYLTERTVHELMEKISVKQHIDPQRVVRVLRVNRNGLKIMVDDDVVRELPDGQDMVVETKAFGSATAANSDNIESEVELQLSY
ncbi:CP2 transcription factor-domain-containing protein [Aspergillus coremiiformis]|uniref:CP2 transcription factor-domain-containing protein n=1 Tax=Aspergillus coremiiformis TaxID=138285 RepID=A0A5N6Z643_9EURO|nr:CP2 transcription factor-domain-containing protein [Aspergillus coremiiformis]